MLKNKPSPEVGIVVIEDDLGLFKNRSLPSKTTMAKNIIKETAKHIRSGLKGITEEEHDNRVSICNFCQYLREDNRCSKCGCFMKVKAKWKTSKCPIEKW